MEMKYYNASNNFKAPIPREPKPYTPPVKSGEIIIPQKPENSEKELISLPSCPQIKKKWSIENKDDMFLLGLILVLLMNQCDDYVLLFILGYLLFVNKGKA